MHSRRHPSCYKYEMSMLCAAAWLSSPFPPTLLPTHRAVLLCLCSTRFKSPFPLALSFPSSCSYPLGVRPALRSERLVARRVAGLIPEADGRAGGRCEPVIREWVEAHRQCPPTSTAEGPLSKTVNRTLLQRHWSVADPAFGGNAWRVVVCYCASRKS